MSSSPLRFPATSPRTVVPARSQGMLGTFSFGPFRLLPGQQLLLDEGTPVRLGSRALTLLTALVENAGELVSKSELMARAWPDSVVEENNVKVHIATLRRALRDGQQGHRYLSTMNGRGYRFVAPVDYSEQNGAPAPQSGPGQPVCNLPSPITQTIGRADATERLREELSRHRLVNVLGPGGIGKTTVALRVAEALLRDYAHGVRFVDLAPVADPGGFSATVVAALGLTLHSGDQIAGLVTYLRDRHMLIVLDTCDHLVEEAALFAEQVMRGAPNVAIMTTSRQPLRASGERLYRLLPLRSPLDTAGLTAAEALGFSAVQLFVDRCAAGSQGFELSDGDVPVVADICRSLDNLPLAIELVATRFDAFGLNGLSLILNDRCRLLNQSRRTLLTRHRTLGAAFDWSYQRLPKIEATILRRLAVFATSFALEAASDLAEDAEISAADVIGGVHELAEKSLLSADVSGTLPRYRLLHTTRAYALQKLAESGELETVSRRHAGQRSVSLSGRRLSLGVCLVNQ